MRKGCCACLAVALLGACALLEGYDDFMRKGREAQKRGEPAAAAVQFERAVTAAAKFGQTSPRYEQACFGLGEAYLAAGKGDQARIYFEKALVSGGKAATGAQSARILRRIAGIQLHEGNVLLAESNYKQALKLFSEAADSEEEMGRTSWELAALHATAGKYAQAEAEYSQALTLAGSALTAHEVAVLKRSLANAVRMQDREEEAAEIDRQATGFEVQGIKDRIQGTPSFGSSPAESVSP
jgi:tetratricopeptide (TPR) repeat protein